MDGTSACIPLGCTVVASGIAPPASISVALQRASAVAVGGAASIDLLDVAVAVLLADAASALLGVAATALVAIAPAFGVSSVHLVGVGSLLLVVFVVFAAAEESTVAGVVLGETAVAFFVHPKAVLANKCGRFHQESVVQIQGPFQ